jgi:hypothetical protein
MGLVDMVLVKIQTEKCSYELARDEMVTRDAFFAELCL